MAGAEIELWGQGNDPRVAGSRVSLRSTRATGLVEINGPVDHAQERLLISPHDAKEIEVRCQIRHVVCFNDLLGAFSEEEGMRMTSRILALAILVVLSCSGCAFQAQAVKIAPSVKSTSIISGGGKTVELVVLDERTSKVVGQRGVGGVGADMTIEGDLREIVVTAITTGLSSSNFLVQNQASDGLSRLRVEIRDLQSKNIMGFWSGTLRMEFGLKGICKAASGGEYEQMYNGLFEKSIQVVPTSEKNNEYISAAVSDGIGKLISDDQMLRCLAE